MTSSLQAGLEALTEGRAQDAIPLFKAMVAANPRDHDARYWLASAMMQGGDPEGARVLDDARTMHALSLARTMDADLQRLRTDPDYAIHIGGVLYGRGFVAIASVAWGMALSAGRMDAGTLSNYALALQHQGRVEDASDAYRAAAEVQPIATMHQFLVYAQLFCEDGEARHFAEARAWAERYLNVAPPAPHANGPRAGRKLRIGYVAPNFAKSQLRQFIAPVFENHDPEAVEVVLYTADGAADTTWPSWIEVKAIGQLSDADAAAMIREDGIDILNDCWGHTAGSRLGVFALKPAPVQTAWINFAQTTGLSQIDYVLHARTDRTPNFDGLFSEGIWPVAEVFTPFQAGAERLPPAPTPAKETGRITFGSFNHPAKLSWEAAAVWATVLRNRPGSQLVLKYRYYADPVLQRATQALFLAHGVAPDRLVFSAHSAGADYYRAFQAVDLMLDCFPCPGSTTTLEALSNGVPVLAMCGDPPNVGGFYARTLLEGVGLPELVTNDHQDFVDRALALTEDVEALDALRARVRPGFDDGPISDGAGFTRRLEAAFGEMFDRWEAAGGKSPVGQVA